MPWRDVHPKWQGSGKIPDADIWSAGIADSIAAYPDVMITVRSDRSVMLSVVGIGAENNSDTIITPAQARELAGLLVEAADIAETKENTP